MSNPIGRPTIILISRLIVGAVFLYAGMMKARDPQSFADDIYAYQILPTQLINPTAIILPILEILVGFLLIAGWQVPAAALTCTVLLSIFLIAFGQAHIRGLNIDCGCFGPEKSVLSNWKFALARDIFLLGATIYVYRSYSMKGNIAVEMQAD